LVEEEEEGVDEAGGLEGDGLRAPFLPKNPCDDELGGLDEDGAFGWSSGIGILLRWTVTVWGGLYSFSFFFFGSSSSLMTLGAFFSGLASSIVTY